MGMSDVSEMKEFLTKEGRHIEPNTRSHGKVLQELMSPCQAWGGNFPFFCLSSRSIVYLAQVCFSKMSEAREVRESGISVLMCIFGQQRQKYANGVSKVSQTLQSGCKLMNTISQMFLLMLLATPTSSPWQVFLLHIQMGCRPTVINVYLSVQVCV